MGCLGSTRDRWLDSIREMQRRSRVCHAPPWPNRCDACPTRLAAQLLPPLAGGYASPLEADLKLYADVCHCPHETIGRSVW